MLKLRVVQAAFGDSLIVEFGSAEKPRYILIDGGPGPIYDKYLKPELEAIGERKKKLDLVICSHVDNDHILGLAAFAADLRSSVPADRFIGYDGLWHNSFSRTIDRNGDITRSMQTLVAPHAQSMSMAGAALLGVKEGNKLRVDTMALGIPINDGFASDLISLETSPHSLKLDNLKLTVVGPTEANLRALENEWRQWLEDHEDVLTEADPTSLVKLDQTVPNLSSIMLLAEADEKKLLLTGDGRGDHLIDGLRAAGRLDGGSFHANVLKMPHHGSERNVTRGFFDVVTADTYVMSANGRDGNPDLATLIWLVEAAQRQGRKIDIFVTNETPSTKSLTRDYPPQTFGYRLHIMDPEARSEVIALAE